MIKVDMFYSDSMPLLDGCGSFATAGGFLERFFSAGGAGDDAFLEEGRWCRSAELVLCLRADLQSAKIIDAEGKHYKHLIGWIS